MSKIVPVKRAVRQFNDGEPTKTSRNKTPMNAEGQSFKTITKGDENHGGTKDSELCDAASRIYRLAVDNEGHKDGHGDQALRTR